jgi:hypothetical protein
MQQKFQLTPGARAEVYETGSITTLLFCAWFQKFGEFSGNRNDSPALLLLDWYGSHTNSLQLNNIARERA